MSNRHRTYALTALLCAAVWVNGCGRRQAEEPPAVIRPVKTMLLAGGEVVKRSYPGKILASRRVNLSFRVGGPLIELRVKEGDPVQESEILAKIDPRDYRIALDDAKAELRRADAEYKRYVELYAKDAVSKADLDKRRADQERAQAAVDNAAADLADTELKASYTGEVGERYVENFEDVRPKQNILSLLDFAYVDIIVDVPEGDVATIDSNTVYRVYVTFDFAPNQTFEASVKEKSKQADPRTQTYRVTLTMPQPEDLRILSGMSAEVHLERGRGGSGAEVFVVPAVAVFAGDDGAMNVWVVDPVTDAVHARAVEAGAVTGDAGIEVLSGLHSGERIAVAGVATLREEMQVRPIEEVKGL